MPKQSFVAGKAPDDLVIILPPEQRLLSFSLIGVNPGSSVVFYCLDTAKNSSKLSPSFA